ncbi:MAG: tRNA 2-thiouridine(34) synthase MnmA [Steroidobacteraceae bacterium]
MRVIVALSGGVDSAVAALLMVRAGHEVHGLHMQNWEDDDGYCTAADDLQDARAVARELDIPLHTVDLSAQYRARVFELFLSELRAGRTPNPDVLCNREIKFGDCLHHAQRLGADRLVTGHYARIEHGPDGPALLKGLDPGKDQSYFLHAVRVAQFETVDMPLGRLQKAEVRDLARSAGLPVHAKADSTGICFIGERPFREFLRQHLSDAPGPILDSEGRQWGEHPGLHHFTLGQRGGIGLGGLREASAEPWYVAAKRESDRALIVVQGKHHPLLQTRAVLTETVNWLVAPTADRFSAGVKLRYRQEDQQTEVEVRNDGTLFLRPEMPQRAVTPGQSAVLYVGERCLGGGVIAQTTL